MEKFEKALKFNNLLATYGVLLSSTQKEILESYFSYDLSISEIATERGVSRAAIEDALQKGTQKLEEYEDMLHLLDKKEDILNNINKIRKENISKEIEECLSLIERRL